MKWALGPIGFGCAQIYIFSSHTTQCIKHKLAQILDLPFYPKLQIRCSPKLYKSSYKNIASDLQNKFCWSKFIIIRLAESILVINIVIIKCDNDDHHSDRYYQYSAFFWKAFSSANLWRSSCQPGEQINRKLFPKNIRGIEKSILPFKLHWPKFSACGFHHPSQCLLFKYIFMSMKNQFMAVNYKSMSVKNQFMSVEYKFTPVEYEFMSVA